MSNDEAVQNWFRHDTRPIRDPEAIGAAMADLAVGGLLRRPARPRPTVAASDGPTPSTA